MFNAIIEEVLRVVELQEQREILVVLLGLIVQVHERLLDVLNVQPLCILVPLLTVEKDLFQLDNQLLLVLVVLRNDLPFLNDE